MTRKTFTTSIEEQIQKAFKQACKDNEEKMNDVLEAFMQGYVNGDFILEKQVKISITKKEK
ncbi:hypothetical protein [Paenibacillus macerans]|uniref:Uncharacterized protein n=1 Tax=Paenibacillus macerans TaxID=44252 RepID=A0A090Y3V7_PAEMA|nr:hypothetical protein [Paenibacillus macerans]KFM93084.1 hypothetical protein DJ90_2927 [Paenibacillus macerans]MCY7558541.1 hypothetical protein [Paenibacillus macerans]MEC0153951.1 hypothetical protein [Paenibacillus macerans]SUA84778.1 Uncharacterised protein [Paenibacillus macerans]